MHICFARNATTEVTNMSTYRSKSNGARSYDRNKYTVEKEVKKHCPVCEKAGLPARVFTSHFTKSVPGPKGIIVCPTILNNECSFCFNRGHLKSACPAVASKEKHDKKLAYEERRSQKAKEIKTPKSTVYKNRFGEYESSDSDEETPVATKNIGPSGPKPVDVKPIDPSIPTFAEMLAREPPKPTPSLKDEVFQSMFTFTPLGGQTSGGTSKHNWIDTDDEEEYDENW